MRRILGVTGVVVLLACASDGGSSSGASSGGSSSGGSGSSSSSGGSKGPVSGSGNGYQYAFAPTSVGLDCNDTAAAALARGAPKVTVGNSTIIVGYQQVSGNDQDPIVARYDGDQKVFCEHTKKGGGIDGRAYGVTWDGAEHLYVVYTIVGGGTAFDAAAKGGWVTSYGDGGASSKVAVVGALDPKTGVLTRATFVPSKKTGNKTNTLVPADAIHVLADGSLEFFGSPAWCTLNPDKSIMCDASTNPSKDYPKEYRARFAPDLSAMTCASATGVSIVKQPCP
jgi:hypothetical protein